MQDFGEGGGGGGGGGGGVRRSGKQKKFSVRIPIFPQIVHVHCRVIGN